MNWTVYHSLNSKLPSDYVRAVVIEDSLAWIGTAAGLADFDGVNWNIYNRTNSGMPANSVYALAVGHNRKKWIGTSRGLARFDTTGWKLFDIRNSSLPTNDVTALAIDAYGHRWIGTRDGLAVFQHRDPVPIYYLLSQNYPNPFSARGNFSGTNINFRLLTPEAVTLKIFDLLGREIATLLQATLLAGEHTVRWQPEAIASGVYFYRLQVGNMVMTKKMVVLP